MQNNDFICQNKEKYFRLIWFSRLSTVWNMFVHIRGLRDLRDLRDQVDAG